MRPCLNGLVAIGTTAICLCGVTLPSAAQAPPPGPANGAAPPPSQEVVRKAAQQFDRAVGLQRTKRYAQAVAAYREFIRQVSFARMSPLVALPAFKNIASIYQSTGDAKSAEVALRQAESIDANDAGTLARLAGIWAEEGRYDDAEREAHRAFALKPAPEDAASCDFALGRCAMAKRRYDDAEKLFRLALALRPNDAAAQFDLGVALLREKKTRPALDALGKSEAAGRTVASEFAIGVAKQEVGDTNGALAAYAYVLSAQPKHPDALYNRASLLQQAGRTPEAIAAWLRYLDVRPGAFEAEYGLGQLFIGTGNTTAAIAHLRAALRAKPASEPVMVALAYAQAQDANAQRDPKARDAALSAAESTYRQAIALAPDEETAQMGLGSLYERTGRYDEALAIYRKLLARLPDRSPLYFRIARIAMARRDPDAALDIWRKYRARRPDDIVSYDEAARVLDSTGKSDAAIAEWKLLLERHPNEPRAMIAIGRDLALERKNEEARSEFLAALAVELLPPSARRGATDEPLPTIEANRRDAYIGLARVEQSEGKTSDAIGWWLKLKTADDETAKRTGQAVNTEAYSEIARAYEIAKQDDMAIAEYRALARLAPGDPAPYANIARLASSMNRLDEALAAYREEARRSSDPVDSLLEACSVLERQHKLETAIAEYRTLQAERPNDSRISGALALAYEKTGRDDEAITALDAVLRADPHANWAITRKAIALSRLKRYPEARALLEQRVAHGPDDPETYADLANVYDREGNAAGYRAWLATQLAKGAPPGALMDATVDAYARAKQADDGWKLLASAANARSTDTAFLTRYAQVLIGHGRRADATAIYLDIARRLPSDSEAQRRYVDQLDAVGDTQAGTRWFQALAARPDLPTVVRANAYTRVAERSVIAKDRAAAIDAYREALKLVPDDLIATGGLATQLTEAGRPAEAIEVYDHLLTAQSYPPTVRAEVHVRVGTIYEKQGAKQRAIDEYHAALKIVPGAADAIAGLHRLGVN